MRELSPLTRLRAGCKRVSFASSISPSPVRLLRRLRILTRADADPRVGRIVFGPQCSLPLMIRRFGGVDAFEATCQHVEDISDGLKIRGWWIGPRRGGTSLTILYLCGARSMSFADRPDTAAASRWATLPSVRPHRLMSPDPRRLELSGRAAPRVSARDAHLRSRVSAGARGELSLDARIGTSELGLGRAAAGCGPGSDGDRGR